MQVIIIEDEPLTAEDLAGILLHLPYGITVPKILSSVKESVEYLQENAMPELFFCDMQLGDGHSFDIFKLIQTDTPIIFCTAYNQYALDAFSNNGVGYVLKPFTKKSIRDAVEKFYLLKKYIQANTQHSIQIPDGTSSPQTVINKPASILVNWKDKILPVKISDIALFGVEFKSTRLITKSNHTYLVNYTLEELEELCSADFYRANRQFLINKSAVVEVLQYNARKLFVKLSIDGEFDLTIAKAKVPEFLSWLKS